jgi:hypothetical protein
VSWEGVIFETTYTPRLNHNVFSDVSGTFKPISKDILLPLQRPFIEGVYLPDSLFSVKEIFLLCPF